MAFWSISSAWPPGRPSPPGISCSTSATTNTPSTWATAPAPVSVTTLTGPNGDLYADIIWANNAIQNQYLQVTVEADADTGLASAYTFYYGNAIGETGNSTTDAKVDGIDVSGTQANQTGIGSAGITNVYDFNRDGKVNAIDVSIAQSHQSGINPVRLIMVPANSPSALATPTIQLASPTDTAGAAPVAGAIAPVVQGVLPAVAPAVVPTVTAAPFTSTGAALAKPTSVAVTTAKSLASARTKTASSALGQFVPPSPVASQSPFSSTPIASAWASVDGQSTTAESAIGL